MPPASSVSVTGRASPPVVGLAGQPEHPARHRHRHPLRGSGGGQLADERVHHFDGRFACDRYAAALLSTSFSCSSSRIRFRASRSSADLARRRVRAWRPRRFRHGAATSTACDRVDAEVGGDLFQRDAGLAVARDPHDVLAELLRIRLGHCSASFQVAAQQARSGVTQPCSSPAVRRGGSRGLFAARDGTPQPCTGQVKRACRSRGERSPDLGEAHVTDIHAVCLRGRQRSSGDRYASQHPQYACPTGELSPTPEHLVTT